MDRNATAHQAAPNESDPLIFSINWVSWKAFQGNTTHGQVKASEKLWLQSIE
jgi:hypothetical protein